MDIIYENEQAYLKRYGRSLKGMLSELDKDGIDFERYFDLFKISNNNLIMPESIPEDVKLLVIFGLADGEYVRAVLSEALWVDRIVIYEPEEASFLYACCKSDLSDLLYDSRIIVVPGRTSIQDDLRDTMDKSVDTLNLEHIYCCSVPGYRKEYAKMLERLIDAVKDLSLAKAVNLGTEIRYRRKMYENNLYALSLLCNNNVVGQLFEQIKDTNVPIILVGAGPSLEKNAGLIKELKGKGLIIACTHATDTLERFGSKPDLVAMVDMEEGYDYTEHDVKREYRMLFSPNSAREIQRLYRNRGIYFSFSQEFNCISGLEGEISDLDTGGSVITAVFSLFVRAGFLNFVLVGEDLAFSCEGKTHAGNYSDLNDINDETMLKTYSVEGINGDVVRSRYDWVVFRDFFERMLRSYEYISVIDATEGGALIHGSKVRKLVDVVNDLKDNSYPIKKWIENLPQGCINNLKEVSRLYSDYIERCGRAQLLFGDAIMMNRMIQERFKTKQICGEAFQKLCKDYDVLYHEITDSNDTVPIRSYCADIMYDYSEKAQFLNEDKDILKRLLLEEQLFSNMRLAGRELRVYISELKNELDGDAIN